MPKTFLLYSCVHVCSVACPVRFFVTLWVIAHQVPLSMGFSRQEQWSELPCPPQGDLTDLGIEPTSSANSCIVGRFFTAEPQGKPSYCMLSKSLPTCPTLCDQSVACQAPLPVGFSRQEYWNGLPFPSPSYCIGASKNERYSKWQ